MTQPRIALFSDSYHEANGVARTAMAIEACAKKRNVQLLSVHAGPETRLVHDGSIVRFDLKRSNWSSFRVGRSQRFDVAMCRHAARVRDVLRRFAPDVIHFTGPGDVGQLGAYLGHRLGIPMVGSWPWPQLEGRRLRALAFFYRLPRVILAPNRKVATLLEGRTGRPTRLMRRGVETEVFAPAKRHLVNTIVNIGYVGRLAAEKNVRLLQVLERELDAEGLDVRFTIVGDGGEREWLERHMLRAEFTGILRGDALARAYAQMDIFAFPSELHTEGNVLLEAMASGLPVITIGGSGVQGFIQGVRSLVRNRERRKAMGSAARARATELLSSDGIFTDACHAYDLAISEAHADDRAGVALSPA